MEFKRTETVENVATLHPSGRISCVAANENVKLFADKLSPAQALFAIMQLKAKLQRENRINHCLVSWPSRRKIWDELNALEACLRWKYFRK